MEGKAVGHLKQRDGHQHNWLIELIVFWEGQINATRLIETSRITRQTASEWIKQYQDDTDNTLKYSPTAKAKVISQDFTPRYINQTIDEYLNWLELGALLSEVSNESEHSHIYRIRPPNRFVSPLVIRPLIKAIRNKTAVDCEYLSVKSADPIGRLIYPHSFVKAANRWHIRAYCEYRKNYLDFVLSRFQSVEYDGKTAQYSHQNDTHWNTEIELILAPDSRLNDRQKRVIEQDYGMENGQLVIKTRAALVKYTLDDLQIKIKMLEADPQAQQLICVNYPDIKQWLYD
ncbi:WYL domain-containing protein [Marinomonas balearica]|uniref:WYL domain-containing protein n=1 Tax=Marinomonas balearica TaxID=491947 RepID=A0A4R6M4M8_9GAMM|nr:WYL domain-containing protein [Marinomonas balearica]TDO96268.1 WYL domain-containing protein [Marinomonas balearica]